MLRTLQIVALAVLGAGYGLSWLSRRFPQVSWLRLFRYQRPQLSPEQQTRLQRSVNIHAGIELILLGLIVPMGYAVMTVMFFSSFTTTGYLLVGACSVLLIGLGFLGIWQNRRHRE